VRFRLPVRNAAIVSAAVAVSLTVQSLGYVEAAAPKRPIYIPAAPQEKLLSHTIPKLKKSAEGRPSTDPASSVIEQAMDAWPEPETAQVTAAPVEGQAEAGDLPVTVDLLEEKNSAAARNSGNDQTVEVRMLGAEAARKAGVAGALFSFEADGPGGRAAVRLDYQDFADAIGGTWASRLQLVELPTCILTTPQVAGCREAQPLATSNDATTQQLAATVDLAPAQTGSSGRSATSTLSASTTLVAAMAGPSGSEGDFTSTSLAPSGSWSQTGATGAFTWEYPLTLPPAGTGASVAPTVSIDYNSQAVDGQNTSTNNQSSLVGQGWSYEPGFVERTYRPCADDTSLPDHKKTNDLCWAGPIVTLSMPGGVTASLVKDDATGEWRGSADNGAEIELRTGADNGAWSGEHWVVTTTDGTKYFFGLNRLPGSTANEATNSAWTVPVHGPRSGDPCYDSSADFAQSRCASMAYRWNLDYVRDVHGNATVYSYGVERNHYASTAPDGANDRLAYDRGGYLENIRYGLHTAGPGLFGIAPQRVDFNVEERCFAPAGNVSYCAEDNFDVDHAARWPDVPIDQACKSTGTCDNHAPTFWSRKRLTAVTTKYHDGTEYRPVDSYVLDQEFSTGTIDELLLKSITRKAHKAGSTAVSPAVTFDMSARPNRVTNSHNLSAMIRSRLHGIRTETGQIISVSYSGDDGQAGRSKPLCTASTLPSSPSQNTSECYPVRWTPPLQDEILDYFHKYVVTEVRLEDANATAPDRVTTYHYLGDPAWHYDDNEVLRPKFRTWAQFRGYEWVETRVGDATNVINGVADSVTASRTQYFRGMNRDLLPGGGRREVSILDATGTERTDNPAFVGMILQTVVFDGVGGPKISTTSSLPKIVTTTATRERGSNLDPAKAEIVRQWWTAIYTYKATNPLDYLLSTTTTEYDLQGRPTEVTSSASGAKTNCVKTTYADSATTGVHSVASEVTTYELTCPTAATPSPTVRRAVRTFYDGSNTLGVVTKGDATRTDKARAVVSGALQWVTSSTAYDDYGRAVSSTVANPGATPATRTTTTTYTPAGTGALRQVQTTQPLSTHVTRVWVDPARGYTTKSQDVANLVTEAEHDEFGRLTAVWRPGQAKGTDPATETYQYVLQPDRPLAVTSKSLVDPGNGAALSYKTRVVIYDAFGAIRQAQAEAVGAGGFRVVTDNFNDSHGWGVMSVDHWYTDGEPGIDIVEYGAISGIDDWKTTKYDGTGRPTVVTGRKGQHEITSTTRTIYGGDRTTIIPPAGGVTSTSISDGRGQPLELQQYLTPPTVSGNNVSGGTFQRQTYAYDSIGQQIQQKTGVGVSGKEATWTNTYDLLGRVTSAVSPDSGATTTSFYDTGEIKTRTDGAGRVLAYTYDALGRALTRRPGSLTAAPVATWTYDSLMVGQPTASTSVEGGLTYTKAVTGYDPVGRPLGTKITLPTTTGFKTDYVTSQTWTKTGLPATLTYANTRNGTAGLYAETLTHRYDSLGTPTQMSGDNAYVSNASYTPYGEPSRYVFGLNNETMTMLIQRDAKTRRITETSLSGQLAAPQLDRNTFTYDTVGNLTKAVNQQGSTSTGPIQTQCFAYDNLRQLKEAWSSTNSCATNPATANSNATVGGPQPYWLSWTYDAAGNRETQVKHGVGSATAANTATKYTMSTAGISHALTNTKVGASLAAITTSTPNATSYTYNVDGAMKTRTEGTTATNFTYGVDGAVETVSQNLTTAPSTPTFTSNYVEDADGQVLLRKDTASGTTTTTLYLPGQEVKVTSSSAATTTAVTKYYTFNGQNVAVRTGISAVKYLVSDLNGSNQVAVDPVNWTVTRRYLDPFGNTLNNASGAAPGVMPGSRAFMNQPWNAATGLVDMGARLYDPKIGRFTSVDPILSPNDTQAANGYTYAVNNPVNFTDATGLMTKDGGGGGDGKTDMTVKEQKAAIDAAVVTGDGHETEDRNFFAEGFTNGLDAGGEELIDSLNPANIVSNLKNLITNPPSPKAFFTALFQGLTHWDEFKSALHSWQNGDLLGAGYKIGKLVVEIGGDLLMTILGAKAAHLVTNALKAGPAASTITSEVSSAATAGGDVGSATNKIFSNRVLQRAADESGPYHNFPMSFDDEIFSNGTTTTASNFFNKAKPNLSNDSIQYRLSGELNGRSGAYEIFTRPSLSGRTELIMHRFFRPDY
jgi:RHS repeat-associated protein